MVGAARNFQDEKPTIDQLLETLNLALEQADKLGLALVAARICHAVEISEQWREAETSRD
jgi:DNA-binding protein